MGAAFPLSAALAVQWGLNGAWNVLDARSILVLILISFWAIRLFLHIGLRNLTHGQEDMRYNNWRKQWGRTWWWRSYLQIFTLQPLILFFFLTPVLFVISQPSKAIGILGIAGLLVWIAGFIFESIADEQLRRFKKDPAHKGQLMITGLWAWSRHPNYFGEVMQWWGIWLIALELPWGWATVGAPLGITYLIMNVSGVSMLEDLMKSRPGFEEYARRTSRFLPWPPK